MPGDPLYWQLVPGNQQVSIKAEAELSRGVNINISATDYAEFNIVRNNIQTLLNRLSNLKLVSYVKVEGTLQAQIQTPLNLFSESGLVARIQAIARAAVGIGLSQGIKPKELMNTLKLQPDMDGLLGNLMETFLEETDLTCELYGEAAVAIMAHANLVFTGSVLKTLGTEETNFKFIFDAGMGYIAGGGYRLIINFKFLNTQRMIILISDLLSNSLLQNIEQKTQLSNKDLEDLRFFELLLRISIRLTYEIGDEFSKIYFIKSDTFSPRALNVILQEGQRWFLQRLTSFGVTEFKNIISKKNVTSHQITFFLEKLESTYANQKSTANDWYGVINEAIKIAPEVETISMLEGNKWAETMGMIWSATYLADIITTHVYQKSYLHKYSGMLSIEPPIAIKRYINSRVNVNPDDALTEEKLIQFLIKSPLPNFSNQFSEGKEVLNLFKNTFNITSSNVWDALFNYDEQKFGGSNLFLKNFHTTYQTKSNQIIESVTPIVERAFSGSNEITTIFEKALIPAIQMTSDVMLPEIFNNFNGLGRNELQEALSAVLLSLIGGTMLKVSDSLLATVQQNIEGLLKKVADEAEKLGVIKKLEFLIDEDNIILLDPLVKEGLKLVGEPLNLFSVKRKELFSLLYDVVTPIPSGKVREFAYSLKNKKMILKEDSMKKIARLLIETLGNSLYSFSNKMLPKLYQILLDYFKELLIEALKKFKSAVGELKNNIDILISDNIVNKLTDLYLTNVTTIIDKISIPGLPSGLKLSVVKNQLNSKAKGALKTAIEPILKVPFAAIEFSTDAILTILKRQDINGFKNYLIDTITNELSKRIKVDNLEFQLTIPISIKLPLGIEYNKNIKLDSFSIPKNEILDDVQKALTETLPFTNYYRKLLPSANGVFQIQSKIVSLEAERNSTIKTFHKGLEVLGFQRNDSYNPQISLRYLGYRDYRYPIELTLHYHCIPNSYTRNQLSYPNILIFLNGKSLPITSFYTYNYRYEGNGVVPPSLILSRKIDINDLMYGINTMYTLVLDSHGKYQKFFYSFTIR